MNIHPFPYVNKLSPRPNEGFIFSIPNFCKRDNSKTCAKYYNSIKGINGFHTCPFGFSSYVKAKDDEFIIYTCLRIKGFCNTKKLNPKIKEEFIPEFSTNHIEEVTKNISNTSSEVFTLIDKNRTLLAEIMVIKNEVTERREFASALFHEIRRLNTQIKSQIEEASKELSKSKDISNESLKYRIDNVFATSSLVSVRLNSYDFHLNPDALLAEPKQQFIVYKKFEKVKHCLQTMSFAKNIKIIFIGESYYEIEGYAVFEILPFLLFENAIKFSHRDQEIKVIYSSKLDGKLKMTISSFGPQLKKEEKEKVFDRNYRGINAQKVSAGTGIGLYLAKSICEIHNIDISVDVDNSRTFHINAIPYSLFNVILDFN